MLLLLALACRAPAPGAGATVTLDALTEDSAEEAGRRLIQQPMGLHRMDDAGTSHPVALVAVHGFRSEGEEWVEPLRMMARADVELYFLRWDDQQCPQDSPDDLQRAFSRLDDGEHERLIIVGHSYGGLAAFLQAQEYPSMLPRTVHAVASPLGYHPKVEKRCGFAGMEEAPAAEDVTWHQWRTAQQQDGAFKDLKEDPQLVYLPELEVHRLPETWEGERLGHNRSLTWFAKESGFLDL
ncbi:MAG: alpha/beta fold hydrolase [Alphaproteobacteria bacterium]|nr:alpha/beta fold hydrolase [Alphaproteobacteria bacterium]